MRRYFALLLLTATGLLSQCKKDVLHWQQVQRIKTGTSCTIDNIQFINNNTGICGGGATFYQSVILLSADAGYTWTATNDTNAGKEMYGMGTYANNTICLCGIDGDVLHSKDQGKTWQFNRINNWLVYTGGAFLSADTGIFVSRIIQRGCTIARVDSNFKIIDEKSFLFGLNKFYPVDGNTAYTIGYGTVMKTTDKGNTWQYQDVQGDNFTAMEIHGDEMWLCGAAGGIYHTANGGGTWQQLRNGSDITLPHYGLRSIVFKDKQNGWAVGDGGIVIHTNDGGSHWAQYDKFTSSTLRSIALCPNGDLLTGGDNGEMYRMSSL